MFADCWKAHNMPLAVARPTVSGSQAGYIPVEPGQQAVRVETKGRKRAFEVAAGQVVYRLVAQWALG